MDGYFSTLRASDASSHSFLKRNAIPQDCFSEKKIEKQYFDIEKGYKKVRSKRALLFYIWMRKNVQGVEKCLSSRNLKKKS